MSKGYLQLLINRDDFDEAVQEIIKVMDRPPFTEDEIAHAFAYFIGGTLDEIMEHPADFLYGTDLQKRITSENFKRALSTGFYRDCAASYWKGLVGG